MSCTLGVLFSSQFSSLLKSTPCRLMPQLKHSNICTGPRELVGRATPSLDLQPFLYPLTQLHEPPYGCVRRVQELSDLFS